MGHIYRVLPDYRRAGNWELERDGEILSTHEDRNQAVAAGWELARDDAPGRIVIHSSNGQVEDEHTYTDTYTEKLFRRYG